MWSPAHFCVFILLLALQGTVQRLSTKQGQSVYTLTHAHKSQSRFLTQDHTGAPVETCQKELSRAKWALLFKKKKKRGGERDINLRCSSLGFSVFSFLSAILSDQDNLLMLSSVLDWADLAQCLHRSGCVRLYVCLENPPWAHIQSCSASNAC